MRASNQIKKLNGSVILSVLSMAALSSIALFTMMFSIKSLSRSLTLESLQSTAQQLVLIENNKTLSNYIENPVLTNDSVSTRLIADGIEYTYKQFQESVQILSLPLAGFSIGSNFASKLVTFKSQVTGQNIQTPVLVSGLACVDLVHENLKTNPQDLYKLELAMPANVSTTYEFNSTTGEILRNSEIASHLIIDFNFETYQHFSRADLAMLRIGNETRLALIFAVTEIEKPGADHQNNLYVLFDKIMIDQTNSLPLSKQRLVTLTQDYTPTGEEVGFILPLTNHPLQLSALTTIQNTVIFIAQSIQTQQSTGLIAQQNTLYKINLNPGSGSTSVAALSTRLLAATAQDANLKITMGNQNNLIVSTQTEPLLASFSNVCKQVFQYEQ